MPLQRPDETSNIVALKLPAVRRMVASHVWALEPGYLEAMLEVLQLRAEGYLPMAEIAARIAAADHGALGASKDPSPAKQVSPSSGTIAVLPMYGMIAQRASMVNNISGPSGTSTEAFQAMFDAALADPDVSAIVIDIDSPGGPINGVTELASHIFASRGPKRIVAVANGAMASAAYWLGSAADEIAASPSAEVGSIGVYTVHSDMSGALGAQGIKQTVIKAGKYKAEGHPSEPLSDEARAALEERVQEAYGTMTTSIAKHRGRPVSDIRDGYGQGRVLSAKKALDAGMIDRVATLGEVVTRLGSSRGGPKPGRRVADLQRRVLLEERRYPVALGEAEALLAAAPDPAAQPLATEPTP